MTPRSGSSLNQEALFTKMPDGRNLGYAEYGDKNGRPLLYFHGGISSRLDIAFADNYCRSTSIRILAPDRPGTGLSSPMPVGKFLTLESWTEDMKFFLQALAIERIAVLGWSLAGPYVLACAHALPELVYKAATIGGAGPLDKAAESDELGLLIDRLLLSKSRFQTGLAAALLRFAKALPPSLLKIALLSDLSASADREIIRNLPLSLATDFLYESLRQGPSGVVDDYRAASRSWNFNLKDIKQEIDIWHGSEDKLCPLAVSEFLAAEIPRANLKIVPGQGHFLLHKKLADVLDALLG